MKIRLLNAVLLAADIDKLTDWYCSTFELSLSPVNEDNYRYNELSCDGLFVISISDAKQWNVIPSKPRNNTAIIQLTVSSVNECLERVTANGGKVLFGPAHDEVYDFNYGGFADIEGNHIWIVEEEK
jgi:predicted enzyme related to lactoylglutathione lyase